VNNLNFIKGIVDRNLETYIIDQFSERGLGPRVYETDYKVYRIEEFIPDLVMLSRENMFLEEVLDKMLQNFAIFNVIGDIKYFSDKVGSRSKSEFFKIMLEDTNKLNFLSFTVNKMKLSANNSLNEFKKNYVAKLAELNKEKDIINDCALKDRIEDFNRKLLTIEFYVENLEDIFYKCCPDQGIFVLSHNDAHLINIMHTKKMDKVILFDHEYSCYNFIGFDIANYIIENLFYLADDKYPFYKFHGEDLKSLLNQDFINSYKKFFSLIENKYYKNFKDYPEYETLIETAKSRDYLMRIMSLSSIMWSIFAVIYLDFESVWNKSAYDYFNYSFDRLSIYDKFLKFELKHETEVYKILFTPILKIR